MEYILYMGTNGILVMSGLYYVGLLIYSYIKNEFDILGWKVLFGYAITSVICFGFVLLNKMLEHPMYIFESRCIWFSELLIIPIQLFVAYFSNLKVFKDANILASLTLFFCLILSLTSYLIFGFT